MRRPIAEVCLLVITRSISVLTSHQRFCGDPSLCNPHGRHKRLGDIPFTDRMARSQSLYGHVKHQAIDLVHTPYRQWRVHVEWLLLLLAMLPVVIQW